MGGRVGGWWGQVVHGLRVPVLGENGVTVEFKAQAKFGLTERGSTEGLPLPSPSPSPAPSPPGDGLGVAAGLLEKGPHWGGAAPVDAALGHQDAAGGQREEGARRRLRTAALAGSRRRARATAALPQALRGGAAPLSCTAAHTRRAALRAVARPAQTQPLSPKASGAHECLDGLWRPRLLMHELRPAG